MNVLKTENCRNLHVKRGLVLLMVIIMASLICQTSGAYAVAVPRVTMNSDSVTIKDQEGAQVIGTVSRARGQTITLYGQDGQTLLSEKKVADTNQKEEFALTVPESAIERPGTTRIYVKSQPVKGLAASKMISVTIRAVKTQTISAPGSVTLTNLKTTATLNAKASSKLGVTYTSSNPKVVTVSKSGKLTRKKNGKATITITQKGNGTYLAASKKVTVNSRKSTRQEQIDAAVAWAVKIAGDNSFSYGSGSGAHHNGCYFCGTNYGPRKYMKPSSKYKKTYCCNPFVHAAYAHGAKHPKMLSGCRAANGIGMQKSTFYKFGCWKCVGKPSYKNLQKGDVLVKSNHVAMYIGKQKLVEASGGGWGTGSIAVKHMSGSRYRGFSFVMRYTGY